MESMGVVVYRLPHITYPYSSCICSFFAAASLLFVHFIFMFFVLLTIIISKNFGGKIQCAMEKIVYVFYIFLLTFL